MKRRTASGPGMLTDECDQRIEALAVGIRVVGFVQDKAKCGWW